MKIQNYLAAFAAYSAIFLSSSNASAQSIRQCRAIEGKIPGYHVMLFESCKGKTPVERIINFYGKNKIAPMYIDVEQNFLTGKTKITTYRTGIEPNPSCSTEKPTTKCENEIAIARQTLETALQTAERGEFHNIRRRK